MAITRYRRLRQWDPFTSMFDFPDSITDALSGIPRLFERGMGLPLAWHPSVDLYEDDGNVYVELDLPGLSKEDIDISFDGHVLTISGRREEGKSENGNCYWSRERFVGDFHRYVHIPSEVDSEKLTAKFDNGVLKVMLPKAEKARVKKIAIESGKK